MKIRTQKTEHLHLSEAEFKEYFLDEEKGYEDNCTLYFSKGYSYEAEGSLELDEDGYFASSSLANGILYYEDGEYSKMYHFSETNLGEISYIEIEVTPNNRKFIKKIAE